jgi:hypothetical protein
MNYATQYGLSEEQAARTVGDAAANGGEDLEGAVTERLVSALSIRPPVALSGTDADRIRRTAIQITANANPSVTPTYDANGNVSGFDFTNTEEDQRFEILRQVERLTEVGEAYVGQNSLSGEDLNFSGYGNAMTQAYFDMFKPPETTTNPEDTGATITPEADSASNMGITVPTQSNLAGVNLTDIR